jgi:hypothetical protein
MRVHLRSVTRRRLEPDHAADVIVANMPLYIAARGDDEKLSDLLEKIHAAIIPIANVVNDPITAYHGHATRVNIVTGTTTASPAIIPRRADILSALRVAPKKKTPRIGPLMSEATDNAVFKAERCVCCNASPTAICAMPAITTSHREARIDRARAGIKSETTVADIALNEDDIAAARIAATTSPDKPGGR